MRVTAGYRTHRRHKKILRLTQGFYGTRHRLYRRANEALMKALAYSYRDRRNRKRDLRRLWIVRVNAAARQRGLSYSRLMAGLKRAGVAIDRKMLADLAINDPKAFDKLAEVASQA